MLTPSLAANLPRALGLFQAAPLHPGQTAPISGLVRSLIPVFEALVAEGIGSTGLHHAIDTLKSEDRVRGTDAPAEYSVAALGTLQRELKESNLDRLLDSQQELVDRALQYTIPPETLAERAAELERILAGMQPAETGPGPTVMIRKRFPVPPDQVVVTIGRGAVMTPRGGTDATRAAAMRGAADPLALTHLARDLGWARYGGRDKGGTAVWERGNGFRVTPEEIGAELGSGLLRASGIRQLPLGGKDSKAADMPVPFGGALPGEMVRTDFLLRAMGLHPSQLGGTPLGNQDRHMKYASRMAILLIYSALEALMGVGGSLPELYPHSHRVGAVAAHAYPGVEKWALLGAKARAGQSHINPYEILFGLEVSPVGLYMNLVGAPRFDYGGAGGSKENPVGLDRIVPVNLAACSAANTGGPNFAVNGACASALYGLATGAMLLTQRASLQPAHMVMLAASDATFEPLDAPPIPAGFGPKAPVTVIKLVERLIEEKVIAPLGEVETEPGTGKMRKETVADRWRNLSPELKWMAMNRASAPGTRHANGLVLSEGAMGLPLTTLWEALLRGQFPTSIIAGLRVGSGEAGSPDNAGMSQGGITTTMVALDQARMEHGVVPTVAQLHGTSTKLFNIAEIMALERVLEARGITGMVLSALKALTGHTMGAAGGIDLVMAVQSLMEQAAPGLINFDSSEIDPRYAERVPGALNRMVFTGGVHRASIPAILIQAFGFGDMNASAVLKYVPQDVDAAVEVFRQYGAPEWLIDRWKEKVAARREFEMNLLDKFLRGQATHRDLAIELGYA